MSIDAKSTYPKPRKSFSLGKVVNEHFSGMNLETFVQNFDSILLDILESL